MKSSNQYADMKNVARILMTHKLCKDISPIEKAISCSKNSGVLQIEKFKLHIKDIPRNTKPQMESLDVILNVSAPIIIPDEFNLKLTNYAFSMEIMGLNKDDIVKSSWHLDYDDTEGSEYVHPRFHMTYGGKSMENISLGNVLLLPTPRIAYPPMDIILGIDFVLSNFIKKSIYVKIESDSQYRAALVNAQNRFWKPYILSLAHFWCKFSCRHYKDPILSTNLYPNLHN